MSKKEGRYYVEYLGWKESNGLYGREFTEPVIRELLARRRLNGDLPKMTIKLNQNELQISQEVVKKSGSKPEKTKYPPIPTKDATFTIQGLYPDSDVVACIFLGYNPYTKCAVHIHVYRFDSEATATMFARHLASIIEKPELKQRILGIENDLAELGHIKRRSQVERSSQRHSTGSDGFSYGTPSPHSSDSLSPKYPTAEEALKQRSDIVIMRSKKEEIAPDPKQRRVFMSLHEELEYKMLLDDAPILLPPKDYDTIVRRHGHLEIRDEVKATSRSIVGPNGIFSHVEALPYVGEQEGSESTRTLDSDDTDLVYNEKTTDGQLSTLLRQSSVPSKLTRSSSDSNTQYRLSANLRRENSFASSERSNNSDDFADGLYQGYTPKTHRRSKSKENGTADETPLQMAMWSPMFSYNQTGIRSLHSHPEEEVDTLNRTAPAGMLSYNHSGSKHKKNYIITEQNGHHHRVKRTNSQKNKGERRK